MTKRVNRRSRQGFAAVAVLVLAMSAAHAENAQTTYYDVVGSNANALRRQMNAKGPPEGGKRFDAHTEWNVRWNYRYRPTASGCELAGVNVSVSGTILLPRWIHANDVPKVLVQDWDKYLAALKLHEEGHYAHGESAARDIEAMARSFHGSGDCATVVSEFNAQARSIIERYKALDAAYDQETDHGRTQGAQFP
jgi:predicted secreted Zn-dependent protease